MTKGKGSSKEGKFASAGKAGARKSKLNRRATFPIVGIGASAGGLDAFERLLKHLPSDTDMAFVLMQHLDPTHESRLTEILTRATKMPIADAKEAMRVEPNKIYVIPPNMNMRIMHRVLHLEPRGKSDARYMPIDFFFQSLATDQQNNAIGVILSGTASDGTLGMKAIKAEGGINFAQDAASAKYFGMPGSAIAAGAVDFILPPEEIARRLARLRDHAYVRLPITPKEEPSRRGKREAPIARLFSLLKKSFGVDFIGYKFATINRRISRRMALQAIDRLEHYVRRIQQDPEELRALFQDMFIGVTEFFRDPGMFKALEKTVYPAIASKRPADSPIRIWVPGCSTGEEVYSIAISLLEYMGRRANTGSIQIFGTDVNDEAIKKARHGRYGKHIEANVSTARLRRFFTTVDGDYQIIKMVRDLCVFAKHDILKNPPFTRLDMLSCRNLLIYLNNESQRKLLPMFHYALKPNGFLILGPEETVGGFGELFSLRDRKCKFYSRKLGSAVTYFEPSIERQPQVTAAEPVAKPLASQGDFERFKNAADQLILNHYGPPALLLNESLEVLHLRGHTGPYLELSPGTVSLNVLKMAREGLLDGLRASLETAHKKNAAVTKEGLHVDSNGHERVVNLHVVPVRMPGSAERTFLVLFEEATPSGKALEKTSPGLKRQIARSDSGDFRVAQLKQELASTKAYLQSVVEGQESNNEELRSLNEELMSSNEELQSTTEELETTNEELQSANEELATLNDTLKSRSQELDQANNDDLNMFASLNISVVILDKDLHIRRFTPMAQKLLNVTSADVGRRLREVRLPFRLPDLQHHMLETMESLKPWYSVVRDDKGQLYTLQVRPYITAEKHVEGAMIALTDISKGDERFQLIADLLPEPVAFFDENQCYVFANAACEGWFGVTREKLLGVPMRKVYGEAYHSLRPAIEKALRGNPVEYEGYLSYPKAGRRYVHIDYVPRKDANDSILGFYSVVTDMTSVKEAGERFRVFVEHAPVAIIIHDQHGKMVVVNSETGRMFGYSPKQITGQPVEILMPQSVRHKHVEERGKYMKEPKVRPMGIGLELTGRRKDGSDFPLEISLSPLETSDGTFVAATIFDLTDRKRLAEQTRLTTVLEERGRVARDLHDTLAQGFTGVIMNLEAASVFHEKLPEEAKIRLKKAEDVARENLEQVRNVLTELSEPSPEKSPELTSSLQQLARHSGGSQLKFSLRGKPRHLSQVLVENLLFIARQAADNAERHARADSVQIRLNFSKTEVRLRVLDDGRGFDATRVKRGIGLTSMRDRAEYIGGRFLLNSQPGKGTDIEVRVPLSQRPAAIS